MYCMFLAQVLVSAEYSEPRLYIPRQTLPFN